MTTASNAIRNGVLFVLVILIVHFAVRNAVDDRQWQPQPKPLQQQQQRHHQNLPGSYSEHWDEDGGDDVASAAAPVADPAERRKPRQEDPAGDAATKRKSALKKPPPRPEVPAAAATDPELYDYVFGMGAPAAASDGGPPPSQSPSPSPSPSLRSETDRQKAEAKHGKVVAEPSTACAAYKVVGHYENENVMCGGKLFDGAPGLEGFDSASTVPWSSWGGGGGIEA